MTRLQAVHAATETLRAAGVEDPADEARRLLAHAGHISPARLIAEMSAPLSADEQTRFGACVARRAQREPLSQILGTQPFWTLDLKVTRDVLTPRSDTEALVEAVLADRPDRAEPVSILDIATGSGAIVLALLSEFKNAAGVATDLSAAALAVASDNVQRCAMQSRVNLIQTRWADGVEGAFDVLTCNPPYIASAVVDTLEPEVRTYEPRLALDGGADGLAPYPHLFAEARRLLKPGGRAYFEIGFDQGAAARALAQEAGAAQVRVLPDLAGRDRVVRLDFG